MTLQRRLWSLALAVLLPMLAMLAWIVVGTYLRETASAHARLRETTRALSLVVDREIDQRAAVARTLASSEALARGDWQALYAHAKAASLGTGNWVVVVDGNDQILNTKVPFGSPLPARTWNPDRPLASGNRIEVSNLRTGPVVNQPVIAVFAPPPGSGPARYNVGVVFRPMELLEIMNQQQLPAGWISAVLDREYAIVARAPHDPALVGRHVRGVLSNAIELSSEGFVDTVSLGGAPLLAFYSRSPVHGWTFVIGVPKRAVAGAAATAAWQSAAGATMLVLLSLGLVAWAVRRVREPIVHLELAARSIERDEVPEVRPTGLDEVDAVGCALQRAGAQAALDRAQRAKVLSDLKRNEESQRLLVELHDATRGLRDPAQTQWEIVCRVGRHFCAARCAYCEIDTDAESALVARDYADGLPSAAGVHRLADFGTGLVEALASGRTLRIADVNEDPRAVRAAFDSIAARAALCVPLLREGRLVSLLVVLDRAPREFTDDEAALLEQVAERTWFAVDSARAESALRESRDVLSLAMRSGKMGVWSRNLATDRVWWSRELEEIFGLAPGAFAGSRGDFQRLVHPDDLPRMGALIAQAIEQRHDYLVEFRFRHADGDWRWMEGRGRAVYAPDGTPTMLYGLGIDISARRRTEHELLRLNRELSQADRRKDEFLATLAHELRNPLAPLTHAMEILRLKGMDDPQMCWVRDVIERQVRQLTRLVDDLLDVARITRGKIVLRPRRITLAGAVHAAIEIARPGLDAAGHRLDVQLPKEAIWIDADATRLTQVLANLLNNAVKYTPAGGRISVEASVSHACAQVIVRDNGIGLAPDSLAGIFEMFSQVAPALERTQGGLGIGLALARGLVELHGGSIEASSGGIGQGCTFTVRLPLAATPEPAAGAPEPRNADEVVPARLRVLVVDDNVDAAESLSMMLALMGHDVTIAHNGAQALEENDRARPDIVLLDIGMPVMNGYEVARRLSRDGAGHRPLLVALTGWGQQEDKRHAEEAGFDRHLTKPVDPNGLRAVLEWAEARRMESAG